MSAIITQSIDRMASVKSATIGRTISIGSDWTRLRVAMRWSIENTGADIVNITSPLIAFGLCHSTSSMYSGQTGSNNSAPQHFLGLISMFDAGGGSVTFPSSIAFVPFFGGGGYGPLFSDGTGFQNIKNFSIWKAQT